MKRRTLFTLFLFLMALVATPAAAQEIPAGEEPPALDEAPVGEEIPVAEEEPSGADQAVRFEFREASLDSIIEYLSEVTPWTVVKAKDSSTKITAVSDNRVPVSQVLDFLDTALRPAGLASMRLGNVVVIDDADKVKDKTLDIHVGNDPEEIALTDRMIVQIIPLHNVSVSDISSEFSELLKDSGSFSINKHANVIVISGRSQDIHRLVRIIGVVDTQVTDKLKVQVVVLQNADCVEMARIVNEVFKKEPVGSSSDGGGFMGGIMRMFGGDRGRSSSRSRSAAAAANLAGQIVRVVADERTNSLLVTGNEDNIKLVEDVVRRLDTEIGNAMKLQRYHLQFADAELTAKLIDDLFSSNSGSRQNNQRSRQSRWLPFLPNSSNSVSDRNRQVRAVAETRTNMVFVMAHEKDFRMIDDLIEEVDRQVTDVARVEIYRLINSEAADMAAILQEVFRNQLASNGNNSRAGNTRNSSRGGRLSRMMGGSSSQEKLSPAEEVEISADERTNSVIVKASEQYQKVARQLIHDLDADPTEAMMTYTIPLRNANAEDLAGVLRDLLTGRNSSSNRSSTGLPFRQNTTSSTNRGNTRNASNRNGGNTRNRRLGPLPAPQEGPVAPPVEEEGQERRSVEGDVDVQSDGSTNSLVIRTDPRNFEAIQRLVDDLDRMRPQVLIKVLIAEVTLTEELEFGVEGFWENKMTVRGGDAATGRATTDLGVGQDGFTYLLSGDEFQASLNMFAEDGRLKVLATPRILVLDNQTANINVGREVPIITNSQVTSEGNTINTVQYESVGIMLEVTPHINPDGLVTMVVHPEISDVASEADAVEITEGVTNPTFLVNSADTTVSVRNAQTVVIGGLIRETVDDTVTKVPVLGDLPVLGTLFSNTQKRKVKRELMIFLTPYVVFTASELEELTELEKSRLRLIDDRDIEAEEAQWLDRIKDETP